MKKIDKFYMLLPLMLSISILLLNIKYAIVTVSLPGIENVIDSIINYTSIIIGVLTALFGIIITITDKDVMIKLQRNNDDKTIFKYSIETLISNFLLLVISILLQSLIRFPKQLRYTQIIIDIWSALIVFAVVSSVRTIYYLLLISFHQNDLSKRPNADYQLDDEERKNLRENNNK